MNAKNSDVLARYVLSAADDELILAHRNSEWTGHAPILEEDIAFTNIALDEMGHAQLWYKLHAGLVSEDPDSHPDKLIFQRQAPQFRNVQLVELPKGDWAFTLTRQYLFDAYESLLLPALSESNHDGLRETAAKIASEEHYHLRHTQAWVRRLGLGTDESNRRMQQALTACWGYALQLFEPIEGEDDLVAKAQVPNRGELRQRWLEQVQPLLRESDLEPPALEEAKVEERSQHSEHLVDLLGELQQVARTFPEVSW